jgi:hypothetical protein
MTQPNKTQYLFKVNLGFCSIHSYDRCQIYDYLLSLTLLLHIVCAYSFLSLHTRGSSSPI